jgi:hypothetical protein
VAHTWKTPLAAAVASATCERLNSARDTGTVRRISRGSNDPTNVISAAEAGAYSAATVIESGKSRPTRVPLSPVMGNRLTTAMGMTQRR